MTRLSHRITQPEWWAAAFTGTLALTAIFALWYARDQVRVTRQEAERQIAESRKEDQIQHLLAMVSEFDKDPMSTYRRELAKKRLKGNPDDPFEMYRELDFFETVDLLVDRGYLNDDDVWNQFRWWVFNLNADEAVQEGLAFERKRDPNEYEGFESLVQRLLLIDKKHNGKDAHPTQQDVMKFYYEESQIVSSGN
jgi:hypothetical protein